MKIHSNTHTHTHTVLRNKDYATLNNQGKKMNTKLYKSKETCSPNIPQNVYISLFQDLTHWKKKYQHISDNILGIINKTV